MSVPGDIPVTVVMRSYNDAQLLPRTLAALDAQLGVDVSLLVYESASTDGSKEIFEAHGYDYIHHLGPGEYRSSKVLNDGARRSADELVAFVNSDAVMTAPHTLRLMADAILADETVCGAFARQTVRPGAAPMTRVDYDVAFENRHELGEPAASWMSLVCSMVRRSAILENPFDQTLTFAEDAVWSQSMIDRGWRTAYVEGAVAEHSHDYTWEERYRRSYGDAAALARLLGVEPGRGYLGGFVIPYIRRCLRDIPRLIRIGRPLAIYQIPAYRWPLMLASFRGTRDGWDYFHRNPQAGEGCLQPTIPKPE
jgi:rhamnosyltransferase